MKGPDSQEKFIIFTTLTERKFVKKKKKPGGNWRG